MVWDMAVELTVTSDWFTLILPNPFEMSESLRDPLVASAGGVELVVLAAATEPEPDETAALLDAALAGDD